MDAYPHDVRHLVFGVTAVVGAVPVRTEVQACGEGRSCELLLAMGAQLGHCSVLTNALHRVLLDELAHGASHEEAGRLEALPRVLVVQLKDLVKGFLCDL